MSPAQPPQTTLELCAGDRVGPYKVESVLGAGGMGCVYKAIGPDGEAVALKLVRAELALERMFRRRFDREVRMATRVDHPHVVPVVAAGEHEGMPYLAQSWIQGGSLDVKLAREGRLGLEEAVKVTLQVAKGLGAIHEQGLVHRDLKPPNILLDEEGNAYVGDFGLAKDPRASVITKTGEAIGTVDYMAPEQIRGEEVGPAADVYALGCTLFECLVGTPPFSGRPETDILWAHLQDEPPKPSDSRPELSEELDWAVTRALEKDPASRPETPTAYARMVQVAAGVPPLSPGRGT